MATRAKSLVLDTWAILAYLQDEPEAEVISNLIADAHEQKIPLSMSVVNVCEVWYIFARELTNADADDAITDLEQLGIQFQDVNWATAQEAARFKVKGKIALGDCFAAALAKQLKAELVTGDAEFKQVEGQVKILWI